MSTKDRAFEAFEDEGPDAHSAAEWADRLDTSKDYVYQLRGDFKQEHTQEPADASESEQVDTNEGQDTTDTEESHSDPHSAEERDAGKSTGDDSLQSSESSHSTDTRSPPRESENSPNTTESDAETDGGAVTVNHEGTEKLSPAGFEDESTSSIDAPDGMELPESVTPDDFEPGAHQDPTDDPAGEPDAADVEDDQDGDSGGLLDRIRGDSEQRSTEEIVEDTDDPAEKDRREDVLEALDESNQTAPDEGDPNEHDEAADPTPGGPDPTTTQTGMVVDESLVATVFGLPFSQLSQATGWEGWELTEEEKQANAELLVAYCDEQNIDMSTGGLLAMSLISTVGGRTAGYMQYRRDDEAADHAEAEPADEQTGDEPSSDPTESTPRQTDEQNPSGGESEQFDFHNSETW